MINRIPSRFVFGGLLLSSLVAPSCFTTNAGDDDTVEPCPNGQEGCKCKTGSVCDAGLTCNSTKGRCVAAAGGSSGMGGTAGRATGGAGGATGGSAGGAVVTGGTGGSGTGGDSGGGGEAAGGTGGTGGKGGKGGGSVGGSSTGGDSGQAGVGDAGNEGGAPAMGGKGGSAGQGGSGGAGKGGSGGAGKGGSGGVANGGKAGGGGSAGSPTCTPITISTDPSPPQGTISFGTVGVVSEIDPELGGPGLDTLRILFFTNTGGDTTGPITLGAGIEADYETCGHCLLVSQDANDKTYFASAGALTLDPSGHHTTGYPIGTLRNVTLVEVTIDQNSHTTPVPGGACLTLANGDALVNIEPPVAGWYDCPAAYHDDADCDCGCGAPDPACTSSTDASLCQYCYCAGDDTSCQNPNGVNPANTSVCL